MERGSATEEITVSCVSYLGHAKNRTDMEPKLSRMSPMSYSGMLYSLGIENVPLIAICDTVEEWRYISLMPDAVGSNLKAAMDIIAETMRTQRLLVFQENCWPPKVCNASCQIGMMQ